MMVDEKFEYNVMPKKRLSDGWLTLRAVDPSDIEQIRNWRNAQMNVLRQTEEITKEAQISYFEKNIWPELNLFNPRQILLVIESNGQLIGYGGLVHISWIYRRAEISFLLKPELEQDRAFLKNCFSHFLKLIHKLAFLDLKLNRITTETYAYRSDHIDVLESSGHQVEGVLKEHVFVNGTPMNAIVHGLLASEWGASLVEKNEVINVLVTSASGKAPLIKSVKKALSKIGKNHFVTAGDMDPLAPSQFDANSFWLMPRLSDIDLNLLINECINRKISMIIPTRDMELEFWATHSNLFKSMGIKILVSPIEAVKLCLDKFAFSQFGIDRNLPFIPASISPQFLQNDRLVVKERYGAGSRGLGINLSYKEAIEHSKLLVHPIFQPFIEGQEISIDGWISSEGHVAGVVLRRRDRVVSGESQVTTTFRNIKFESEAKAILGSLGLRGPVVMQAFIVEGGLQIIECNPRFGGASTASIAVGLDSLYWSLLETTGHSEIQTFNRAPIEVQQIRTSNDRIIYGSYI